MIGRTVVLGEAVEDVYYEVGETESGLVGRERVSEVDVRVLAGEVSGVLRGDEDHRPAVACVAQHAYDALHHALCDPVRQRRLQRRPPLARELARAVAGTSCRSTSSCRSRENWPGSHSDSKGSIRDPESLPP